VVAADGRRCDGQLEDEEDPSLSIRFSAMLASLRRSIISAFFFFEPFFAVFIVIVVFSFSSLTLTRPSL
jgi:hypothetical protein